MNQYSTDIRTYSYETVCTYHLKQISKYQFHFKNLEECLALKFQSLNAVHHITKSNYLWWLVFGDGLSDFEPLLKCTWKIRSLKSLPPPPQKKKLDIVPPRLCSRSFGLVWCRLRRFPSVSSSALIHPLAGMVVGRYSTWWWWCNNKEEGMSYQLSSWCWDRGNISWWDEIPTCAWTLHFPPLEATLVDSWMHNT